MKDNKKTKTNANYFTKTETLKIAGIIILIASGVEFFLGRTYIGYIISCIGLVVGLVLFIVGSSGRVSEAEISEYIAKNTDGACEIDVEEKALKKRLRSLPYPLVASGFVFNADVMVKKTKKGSLNSSVYSKTVLYPLDTAILVRHRTLLIAEHDHQDTEQEIPYADIKKIETVESTEDITFGKKLFRAKNINLVIETASGEPIIITAQDNVETDTFIKEIDRIVKELQGA
ncbi:MAG: hypothetical protein IKL59_06855 [Clostridia bacterium]|nr:hypothetical protein [Clostridia bacterium]